MLATSTDTACFLNIHWNPEGYIHLSLAGKISGLWDRGMWDSVWWYGSWRDSSLWDSSCGSAVGGIAIGGKVDSVDNPHIFQRREFILNSPIKNDWPVHILEKESLEKEVDQPQLTSLAQ